MAMSMRTINARLEQLEKDADLIIRVAEHRLKPVREEREKLLNQKFELDALRIRKEIQQYNQKESTK